MEANYASFVTRITCPDGLVCPAGGDAVADEKSLFRGHRRDVEGDVILGGGGRTTAGRISCGHNIKIEMSPTAAERMQRIPEFEDIVSMRG